MSVKLSVSFSRLKNCSVLVLGDFFLDTYTTGKVRRISPEAPVPVMDVQGYEERPGGAGNVVLNLQSLGASVMAVGRRGADVFGDQLEHLLRKSGVDTKMLLVESGYRTPVKNRLIAESQQLLRVDSETIIPLRSDLEEVLLEQLPRLISKAQIVAISDYGKGFLTHRLIAFVLRFARKQQIPTIVDPKGSDFTKYAGASILKPNLSEAYAATKLPSSVPLEGIARMIFSSVAIDRLLITRSEAGMTLFNEKGDRQDFPVQSKQVKDVTGAGDTVLAVLCLALANGLEIQTAVQLANTAAGIAIERLGCAQVTLSDLANRLLERDYKMKIFDASDMYALQQVLQKTQYFLLVLQKGQEMTTALFRAIRQLANQTLIIYMQDADSEDELLHLLASLNEVNYILLQSDSVKNLCELSPPYEMYILEKEICKKIMGSINSSLVIPRLDRF